MRILMLILLIILALSGIGMMGIFPRERYRNKETQIEMVDRLRDEDDEEEERADQS